MFALGTGLTLQMSSPRQMKLMQAIKCAFTELHLWTFTSKLMALSKPCWSEKTMTNTLICPPVISRK
jgi:hypothetical protein